jgi:hypothetical protein
VHGWHWGLVDLLKQLAAAAVLAMTHLHPSLVYKYGGVSRIHPHQSLQLNLENLLHSNAYTITTMSLFSSSRRTRSPRYTTTSSRTRRTGFRNPLRRRDPDRVAGGFKAALSNPNTTHSGRKHAKRELRFMVRIFIFILPRLNRNADTLFCVVGTE